MVEAEGVIIDARWFRRRSRVCVTSQCKGDELAMEMVVVVKIAVAVNEVGKNEACASEIVICRK